MNYHEMDRHTAVSPVVAVILMVAITVILSAVIGTFVLDLGQQTASSTTQQNLGVSTSYDGETFTATIITGTADKVKLLVNGTVVKNKSNVSAGDKLTHSISEGATVTIVSVTDGTSSVVSTTTPKASTNTTTSSTTSVTAPTDGLIAYWTFDNTDTSSGTLFDASNSSTGYNASLQSGPTTGVPGVENEAYSFDGTAYLSQPAFPSSLGSFTISFWAKDTAKGDGVNRAIFYDNHNIGVIVVHNGSGDISFGIWDGNGWDVLSVPNNGNTWTHYTFVWNGTTRLAYVNASYAGKRASGSMSGRSNGQSIARNDNSGGNYWKGSLDDMRVYNRTLNQSEIEDIYNATK